MKTVSAAEANRNFSKILRDVAEGGETVTVTSYGRPVAKVVPVSADEAELRERIVAGKRLLERLASQRNKPALTWTREELYEDGPRPETL